MERLTLNFLTLLLLILVPGCKRWREDDSLYLITRILPQVQEFAQTHGITELSGPINTNRITFLRIWDHPDRPHTQTSVRIDRPFNFSLFQEGSLLTVRHFQIRPQPWLIDPTSVTPAQKKVFEAMPNTLTTNRALQLLHGHLAAAGHAETNYHPVVFQQIIYGVGPDGDQPLRLPYYEAIWFRRDVNVDEFKAGNIMRPRIEMVLSGVNGQLVSFGRYHVPLEGGGDWGTGLPQPAHPISTSNYFNRPGNLW